MDTFCLLSVTVLYLSFENPDFFLERLTLVFNSRALREYLEAISRKRTYRIFAFAIHNYRDIREVYGVSQMNKGLDMIGEFLRENFPQLVVFYYRSGRFVLLGDEKLDFGLEKMKNVIENRFDNPWKADNAELYLGVGFVYLNPGLKPGSPDVVLNLLAESLSKIASEGGDDFLTIDEAAIKQSEKETGIKRTLESAIDNNAVEAFLQPIVDASTYKLIGAEALARIRDKDGKLIQPGKFIPIAERNGRINQLGEQVLEKVCDFISNEDLFKMGVDWINVNLSPIQFMRQDLDDRLIEILSNKGVDPKYVHLEVTEEAMIDEALLIKQINNIKRNGFLFVLDDYGRGYSNLSRLKKCPFITIKIDMSIVWEYMEKPDELLPNMIHTFKKMGFSVTAEGIEDERMAKEMARIGCDYLQGYYFSKALTMSEFVEKYS
jgi:EAL domain-containing protein (putative c-di-GMP-specific phosphodiesterase class I)